MISTQVKYTERELSDMMQSAGVRPSVQRLAVLGHINEHRSHPTVDEIYRSLSPVYRTLSRTTVYNTLHLLVEKGVVREVDIEAGNMHYDLAADKPHGHFLCRTCGMIFDMPMPPGVGMPGEPGFDADSVDIYYKGICKGCRSEQNDNV